MEREAAGDADADADSRGGPCKVLSFPLSYSLESYFRLLHSNMFFPIQTSSNVQVLLLTHSDASSVNLQVLLLECGVYEAWSMEWKGSAESMTG